MDPLNSVLMFFGFTLLIASWIQMIVTASQEDFTWGLFSFFFTPSRLPLCAHSVGQSRRLD